MKDSSQWYFREIDKFSPLNKEEANDLIKRYRAGDLTARDQLVNSTLKLVKRVVRDYLYLIPDLGAITVDDLIQEGTDGIFEAIDQFDITKDYKFSGYAYHWITQRIKKLLSEKLRPVHVPGNIVSAGIKINKYRKKFISENQREPSNQELAIFAGYDLKKLEKILSYNSINWIYLSTKTSHRNNEKSDLSYGDILVSEDLDQDKQSYFYLEIVDEYLSCLSETERKIIIDRYGLNGNQEGLSLGTLGLKYGLTGVWIGQVCQKALKKMRRLNRKKSLLKNLASKT